MHFKSYIAKGVEAVDRAYREIITNRNNYTDIYEYLNDMAEELAEAYLQENLASYTELTSWLPGFGESTKAQIFDEDFSLKDMRKAVARAHGFKKWKQVDKKGDRMFDEHFEAAVDAIQSGDFDGLAKLLDEHPDLVNQRSPFGHRATLLHYCATNGVENYHQKLPLNMPQMAALLIEKGSDKSAKSKAYNGKFTAAELAATSGHPVAAGIQKELLEVLS